MPDSLERASQEPASRESSRSDASVVFASDMQAAPTPLQAEAVDASDKVQANLSRELHSRLGKRYDPISMQLSVSAEDRVVCLCFDGVNRYRLFVVAVHASLAQLCVWDPLDLQARKASDSQAAFALSVMQKLLPKHKVQAGKPTSMRVLNASHIFATEQTDGYQCGPIAVRALVHLLFQTEFDFGERSLNNVRIWMAACIAEGKLCISNIASLIVLCRCL
ncbi:TPA: hypothetical protein ACH3X1_004695 [Trebouxia sp. C0004]